MWDYTVVTLLDSDDASTLAQLLTDGWEVIHANSSSSMIVYILHKLNTK